MKSQRSPELSGDRVPTGIEGFDSLIEEALDAKEVKLIERETRSLTADQRVPLSFSIISSCRNCFLGHDAILAKPFLRIPPTVKFK